MYFYLYLFIDLYSRKIVGWQVYDVESSARASEVICDICKRETIAMRLSSACASRRVSPVIRLLAGSRCAI